MTFGTAPNPCPIVAVDPVPVCVTILNPAVVLAETVDVILPSVFEEPAPLPRQFYDTVAWIEPPT